MEKIALFPLGIVVFPHSTVPLHIFEERYQELINTSLQSNSDFGINLVDSSRLYQVGCTVQITNVVEKYTDGRFDIEVTGMKRYRLHSLREGEAKYYTAWIEFFEDIENESIEFETQEQAIALYNELVTIVFPAISHQIQLRAPSTELVSFQIAQKAGLEILQKQELLELRSEMMRLEFLITYMNSILPDLRAKKRIHDVINNDGYLPPSQMRGLRNFSDNTDISDDE